MKKLSLLLLILVIATFLRVYSLDKIPASLFGDEVDVGYQAYSLLKTGQDLYGNSWPTLIHSLSEYRVPLFIYSTVPFVSIFGLNEWGVRLPAVFWGILGVLGIYMLTRKIFNDKVALFATLTLAISPWHIQYSRAAFEVTMLLVLLTWGTYLFIKGLEKKYWLILAAILFALTPYVYSTAVIFMPLLALLLLIIYRKNLTKMRASLVISLVVALLVIAPYGMEFVKGTSGARFSIISIFIDPILQDKVTLAQKAGQDVGQSSEKIFHNKPLIWAQVFSVNYFRAFSPEFLFLNGDPNFRHGVHEMGQMYFYEIALLLLGIWLLIKQNTSGKWLVLGWLLLAPIPAALTVDGGFHATRTFLMLTPLAMLVGLGGDNILSLIKKIRMKYLSFILIVLAVFNISFYLHRYFNHYGNESWRAWHFGFKETFQYVDMNQNSYEKILINNTYEPSLIRFLFWSGYDPVMFHQKFTGDEISKNVTTSFDGFKLGDKFYFGKVNGPYEEVIDNKTLYVASARDDITSPDTLNDKRVNLLKTVYAPTGEPVFYIITGK